MGTSWQKYYRHEFPFLPWPLTFEPFVHSSFTVRMYEHCWSFQTNKSVGIHPSTVKKCHVGEKKKLWWRRKLKPLLTIFTVVVFTLTLLQQGQSYSDRCKGKGNRRKGDRRLMEMEGEERGTEREREWKKHQRLVGVLSFLPMCRISGRFATQVAKYLNCSELCGFKVLLWN